MEIKSGFYLRGFKRIDKGESGAVFIRYGEPKKSARSAPEVFDEGQSYHENTAGNSFLVWLPVYTVVACAIVTRTSKNCYQATAFNEQGIKSFKADTLDGLRSEVAAYFKEVTA